MPHAHCLDYCACHIYIEIRHNLEFQESQGYETRKKEEVMSHVACDERILAPVHAPARNERFDYYELINGGKKTYICYIHPFAQLKNYM